MSVEVLKQIWPEWQIEGKPLGKGSFGVVYKAVRRDHNVESYAAIKVISIPADPSEVDSLRSEGLDMNATRTYLQGIVNDFVSEIQLMESLKGVQNIVSVEDYKVVEKTGEIGWDIYIRMELLTSFNTYICDKKLTEEEVIKLGCDICTALEICAKRNIIHRDIKPENIFINDFGYFKLGDFGIARKMENMTGGLSQKGTFNYMAPEVANSNEYDARVDTYSLGIVLYRLLNGNRLPFLDTEKQLLNPNERRNAVDRRIRGEELPAPCDASPAMADLILRACAYDPDMRFHSAAEMKQALMSVANGTYQMAANNLSRTTSVRKVADNYDRTTSVRKAPIDSIRNSSPVVNTFGSAPKKSKLTAIFSIVMILVLLAGVSTSFIRGHLDKQTEIDKIIEKAQVLADSEDFVSAIAIIEDGLEEYSSENKLQDKLDEYSVMLAEQVKTQTLADAQVLADAGEYKKAMSMIKAAQEAYGDDKEYFTAYKSYHKVYSLVEAEKYAADGDYPSAIKIIAEAKQVNENNVDLISVYNTYCDTYLEVVFISVDSLVAQRKYDEAIAVLDSTEKEIGYNEQLDRKQEEILNSRPITKNLTELKLIESSYNYELIPGSMIDSYGNSYANVGFFEDCGTHSAKFYTQQKYRSLYGTIAAPDSMASSDIFDVSVVVYIYADNQLIYTSPKISRETKPIEIDLDITNADTITIVAETTSWYPNGLLFWLFVET